MYDPFLDEIDEARTLQEPLLPAQSPTLSPGNVSHTVNSLEWRESSPNPISSIQMETNYDAPPSFPADGPVFPLFEPQSKLSLRRPKDLSVVTDPATAPSPSADPLGELLAGTTTETSVRPKPTRKFSTTPLFQPLVPAHTHQMPQDTPGSSFSAAIPIRSVLPSLDPLTSVVPISPQNSKRSTIPKPPPLVNDFTTAAQIRHQENSSRILGEFTRSEALDGDFLGWLDDIEAKGKAEDPRQREQTLKAEEGPPSPPATPVGVIPHLKTPRHRNYEVLENDVDAGSNPLIQDQSASTTVGAGSYFPGTIPRRLTSLLTNPVALVAQMSTPNQPELPSSFDDQNADSRAVFALPTSTSVASLSSFPHPSMVSMVDDNSLQRSIPENFLTHRTPFAHNKYVPPTGAPGFSGERGWDTGGFSADWEGQSDIARPLSGGGEPSILRVPRVLRLIGRKEETAGVMTNALGDMLRLHLPALARLCTKWTLLYSLDQHGISLQTFYVNSSPSADSRNKISGGRKGAILVIRDSFDGIFGGWIAEGIRMNHTGEGHFGGGDSFLWRSKSSIPNPQDETPADPTPDISVYRWTGKNEYIALCEPDSISLGGGDDGKTGLFLSASLLEGSSAKCMTFDNDILCSEEELGDPRSRHSAKFEVIGLEVWGLVSS
ncbi:oxidation resistance protein 1 [Serendipita sp. 405]|nr:oxidation resistance protein 1 [Serendipita sp. 405]